MGGMDGRVSFLGGVGMVGGDGDGDGVAGGEEGVVEFHTAGLG